MPPGLGNSIFVQAQANSGQWPTIYHKTKRRGRCRTRRLQWAAALPGSTNVVAPLVVHDQIQTLGLLVTADAQGRDQGN